MSEELNGSYARVTVPEQDKSWTLEGEDGLRFGRDSAMAIAFPDDRHLSRCAGEIRYVCDVILIVNLSGAHSLYVRSLHGETRLPALATARPAGGYFVSGGAVDVFAAWWRPSGRKLVVEINSDNSEIPRKQHVNEPSSTRAPILLNPETKEFVTALLLCRPRLLGGGATAHPPEVPELTSQILTTMNCWHLLHQFNTDKAVYNRLTGRIHEHLKQLRAKLSNRGFSPPRGKLPTTALADLLIEHDIVTCRHLELLDNPAWLALQEERWWK